jgi:hypothetical protein
MTARFQSGARVICVLALVALATTLASVKLRSPETGIDDANIFLVYAVNFSAGEGFVFNRGGERVEGFTSLLWVLIASGATHVMEEPEPALLGVNVVLLSLTLVAALRGLPAGWAAVFLILVLSDAPYVVWHTITLMETALWSALLTIAVVIGGETQTRRRDAAVLAVTTVLLVLTRPEALVWVPVLLSLCYLNRAGLAGHIGAVRFIAVASGVFVLSAALLTIFRLLYFGFPLPNTYYAKVSPSFVYRLDEGLRYLASFVVSSPVVGVSVLAVLGSLAHLVNDRFRDRHTLVLTLAAATGLVVPVLSGGDHFDGFRFYQPIYPLLVRALLNFVRRVMPRYAPGGLDGFFNRRVRLAATAVALSMVIALQTVAWIASDRSVLLGREFDIAAAGRRVGTQANLVFGAVPPLPDIATITVGGLKYAYAGDVVDLMGLNDTRMAHNGGSRVGVRSHAAFELHTFFERPPTIVLPLVQYHDSASDAGNRDPFANRVLKGLLDRPKFRERYRFAVVRRATDRGVVSIEAWYDRRFLAALRATKDVELSVDERD